ncbi:hypothetical protein STAFG_2039 [Streptomyces afghaniensis 772]|uniref:Uncharacterized protein n=1 Tax=Streptomyces afghaniensis 772 TaxID=1283301 RepID=S4MMW8_9ACTN|nr:hypothetical protein STAFG_2039 [Streptomyces afghaniensis 772]
MEGGQCGEVTRQGAGCFNTPWKLGLNSDNRRPPGPGALWLIFAGARGTRRGAGLTRPWEGRTT